MVRTREKARGDRGDRGLSAPGVGRATGFYLKPLQFSVNVHGHMAKSHNHLLSCTGNLAHTCCRLVNSVPKN